MAARSPLWSPDGRGLAFISTEADKQSGEAEPAIRSAAKPPVWMVGSDGGEAPRQVSVPVSVRIGNRCVRP